MKILSPNKRMVSFAIAHSDSHRYAVPATHAWRYAEKKTKPKGGFRKDEIN